ncbi:MAG: GNAT family N-acetyltransferase [Lachnospiraceae bacterium]|nr:GNAT family N-acetyltransferase [Lachnospiraceae bacterium]
MKERTCTVVYALSSCETYGEEKRESRLRDCYLEWESLLAYLESDPGGIVVVTDREEISARCAALGVCVIALQESADHAYFEGAACAVDSRETLTETFCRRVYAHFHSLPYTVAEDNVHVLRESVLEDLSALRRLCVERGGEFPYLDTDWELTDFDAWFAAYIHNAYAWQGFGMLTLEEKESKRVIGWAGLNPAGQEMPAPNTASEEGTRPLALAEASIGIVLDPSCRGRGIGQKCCRWLLSYAAELGLDAVRIVTHKDNAPMKRIAKALGFAETKKISGPNTFLFRAGL